MPRSCLYLDLLLGFVLRWGRCSRCGPGRGRASRGTDSSQVLKESEAETKPSGCLLQILSEEQIIYQHFSKNLKGSSLWGAVGMALPLCSVTRAGAQHGARARVPGQSRAERCSLGGGQEQARGRVEGRGWEQGGEQGGVRTDRGQHGNPIQHHRVGFLGKDGTPFSWMPEKKRKFLEEKQSSDTRESEPRWGLCSEERRMLQEEEGRVGGGRGAERRAEVPPGSENLLGPQSSMEGWVRCFKRQ